MRNFNIYIWILEIGIKRSVYVYDKLSARRYFHIKNFVKFEKYLTNRCYFWRKIGNILMHPDIRGSLQTN